ncbi:MAG: T9SS type A sorting domain-containing protein [Candidatus Marinimicrobia bacterium]|nr:T9SS type A sorting domain-containing protein [Candidatus Neomarinimicrobiota bacterium]
MLAELEEGLGKESAYYAMANSSSNIILAQYPSSEAAEALGEFGKGRKPLVMLPDTYKMDHPYPNPFNPSTTIQYELPEIADVSIRIYDILGRGIWSYEESAKPVGYYSLQWNGLNNNGRQVASGIYLISFSTPEFRAVRKAVLIRQFEKKLCKSG